MVYGDVRFDAISIIVYSLEGFYCGSSDTAFKEARIKVGVNFN